MLRVFPWALCAVLAALLFARADAGPPPAPEQLTRKLPPALSRGMTAQSARSAMAAKLQVTEAVAVSTTSGKVGEPVYATFKVKNVGDRPLAMTVLLAAGRGPDVPDWDCGTRDWSDCGADFQGAEGLTLQPGEEYAYRGVRVPTGRGSYWVDVSYQDAATGHWSGASGSKRVSYGVTGGELQVVQPLALSPATPRPGQPVVATARVKNVGDDPIPLRYLTAGGRGPDVPEWDCGPVEWEKCIADFSPAEDVVLAPGEEYQYQGLTRGWQRGAYFAEMVYLHAKTDVWKLSVKGGSRVRYDVACDARCQAIWQGYREVLGRDPDVNDLRAAYDSTLDAAQLRAYLCGRAERRPGQCGQAPASVPAVVRSILSYIPLVPLRP